MQEQIKKSLTDSLNNISQGVEGLSMFVDAFKKGLSPEQQKEVDEKLKEAKFDKHIAKAKREFQKAKSQINNA